VQNQSTIEQCWAQRPRETRRNVLWVSFFAFLVVSTALSDLNIDALISERRLKNLQRFLGEIAPYPLRQGLGLSGVWNWGTDLLIEKGVDAILVTLAVSILAVSFSAVTAFFLAFLSARSIAVDADSNRSIGIHAMGFVVRLWLMCIRAIPEYVWAFLCIALLGPGAAPGILALGLHNQGVLGRLCSDLIEDLPSREANALRRIGGSETRVAAAIATPLIGGRYFALILYRWETCLREATVLGLLGISSLGFFIQDARARQRYDEMLFFVFLSIVIVLVGEVVSLVSRSAIRKRYSEWFRVWVRIGR